MSGFIKPGIVLATFSSGVVPYSAPYQGPCDLKTCGEAYSVTRAMKTSYAGPLFQLHNGTSTLEIGQTAARKADMTTWAAFCPSGVSTNCKTSKIYAQIQGSANDLVPIAFAIDPSCNTATACAAPFTIEAATGLPIMTLTAPYKYVIGAGTDSAITGVNAGTSAISVAMNFKVQAIAKCCGSFGVAHVWNAGNTPGTDFELFQSYGVGNGSTTGFCSVANTLCLGIDVEGLSGASNNVNATTGAAGDSGFYVGTFGGTGTNNFTYNYNGTELSNVTATGQNTGTSMHFGGGGDLTTPADILWREGFITNSQLSGSDITTLLANQTAFYTALSFPAW